MNQLSLEVRKRIVFLFIMVTVILLLLVGRFFYIQLLDNNKYQTKALRQRLREIKVQPKRGVIYDRNGAEMAVSAGADTLEAAPKNIKNPKEVAQKLAQILDMDQDKLYQKLTKNVGGVYIARKITKEEAKQIRNLDLSGIGFIEESKRFYPKGNLAAHILGFAGIDSQGLQGIELSKDSELRGNPGRKATESDAIGRKLPAGIEEYVAPENGNNIYLTIDNVLQYLIERELDKAMVEHQAKGATIIMMDPKTGDILALANRPTYDPNHFAQYSPGLWRNRAVSDNYEPGSTFKIITTAVGLEEGVVSSNDRFFDPGYIKVAGQTINCWKHGGHGSQSFAEVVQNSCNPGFVQVGQRIGANTFYKYIKAFGFGNKTRIDLPGEAKGLTYDLDEIGPVQLATISFGHGISGTPIQLISAVSAVASNGQLLKPHLVKEIRDGDGNLIKKVQPEKIRKVISDKTAQKVRELLVGVVDEGSGKKAAVQGYKIGGKTGTAKHYGHNLYDSSFIGIVPADDPQLVTLVVLYGVSSYPYYGSQVAAPIFHNVVKDAVRYLDIATRNEKEEEQEEDVKRIKVPNVKNLSLSQAEKILINKGFQVKLEGAGEQVVDQVPNPEVVVDEGSTVILFFKGAKDNKKRYRVTVPDLKGMRVREAAELLSELGLRLRWSGSGAVKTQHPVTGTTVDSGEYVRVWLE